MLGTITKYNYEKLYGFILGDDNQEYFLLTQTLKTILRSLKVSV